MRSRSLCTMAALVVGLTIAAVPASGAARTAFPSRGPRLSGRRAPGAAAIAVRADQPGDSSLATTVTISHVPLDSTWSGEIAADDSDGGGGAGFSGLQPDTDGTITANDAVSSLINPVAHGRVSLRRQCDVVRRADASRASIRAHLVQPRRPPAIGDRGAGRRRPQGHITARAGAAEVRLERSHLRPFAARKRGQPPRRRMHRRRASCGRHSPSDTPSIAPSRSGSSIRPATGARCRSARTGCRLARVARLASSGERASSTPARRHRETCSYP